jgi:hypothetical protein
MCCCDVFQVTSGQSLPIASRYTTESQDADFVQSFAQIWADCMYYLHLLSGADEVSQESWQLVTAIHDEDDCLILCETHKVMTTLNSYCINFGFVQN